MESAADARRAFDKLNGTVLLGSPAVLEPMEAKEIPVLEFDFESTSHLGVPAGPSPMPPDTSQAGNPSLPSNLLNSSSESSRRLKRQYTNGEQPKHDANEKDFDGETECGSLKGEKKQELKSSKRPAYRKRDEDATQTSSQQSARNNILDRQQSISPGENTQRNRQAKNTWQDSNIPLKQNGHGAENTEHHRIKRQKRWDHQRESRSSGTTNSDTTVENFSTPIVDDHSSKPSHPMGLRDTVPQSGKKSKPSVQDRHRTVNIKLERQSPTVIPEVSHAGKNEASRSASMRSPNVNNKKAGENSKTKRTKDKKEDRGETQQGGEEQLDSTAPKWKSTSTTRNNSAQTKRKRDLDEVEVLTSKKRKQQEDHGREDDAISPIQKISSTQTGSSKIEKHQSDPSEGDVRRAFLGTRDRARSMPPKFDDIDREGARDFRETVVNKVSSQKLRGKDPTRNSSNRSTGSHGIKDNGSFTGKRIPEVVIRAGEPRKRDSPELTPSSQHRDRNWTKGSTTQPNTGRPGVNRTASRPFNKKGPYNLRTPIAVQPFGDSNTGLKPRTTKSKV
jgi:hypothetical protein